jgi:hypothetical protein
MNLFFIDRTMNGCGGGCVRKTFILGRLLSCPKRRLRPPFSKKKLYYQARLALKIPSEAKNPDGNGISVGVICLRRTADGIFSN